MIKSLQLSPADESGRNLCPWATDGCRKVCLSKTGQNAMSAGENARLWRTALYFGARDLFDALLDAEIRAHERSAARQDKVAALRLDTLSDLGLSKAYAEKFPGVQFYEYTKSVKRALKNAKLRPDNYRVCFSYSGENGADALRVLTAGGNVAVVFNARPKHATRGPGDALPATWHGHPVINGDLSDARWLDPRGHVVGLSFKATHNRAQRIADAGAFVQPIPKGARLLPIAE